MQSTLREIIVKRVVAGLATLCLGAAAVFGGLSLAGQERYEYDPIGRLVRFVDSNNQVTDYSYDAAGNLLAVSRGGSVAGLAPVLAGVSPGLVRRGISQPIVLTGQNLQLGNLQASDPALDLSNVRQSATQILADLTVGASAMLGTQTLTFSNGLGAARIAVLIGPGLPSLVVEPNPLALPPDGASRTITLSLSNADVLSHTVDIVSSDTTKASVSPASVNFAPGQTTARISVTPKVAGFSALLLSSSTLRTTSVPIFLTTDFRGVNTSHAPPVGVVVGQVLGTSTAPVTATFAAARVGVAVGPVLTGLLPQGLAIGTTQNFVVTGRNLPGTLQVAIEPATGVTVSQVRFGTGSTQISLQLQVDANAAAGTRRIVVSDGAGQKLAFTEAGMSLLSLTTGQPDIESVEPFVAVPGSTVQIKVRGRHLQGSRLLVSPDSELRVDALPVINADGTELTAKVQIGAFAARGPRLVQVVTPSGLSSSQMNGTNQLNIVSEIGGEVSPIFAPPVGIMVGPVGTTGTVGPIQAPAVGIVFGAFADAVAPSAGLVGSSVNLVINGAGLQTVLTATLAPLDGLTVGAFSVNPQGTQLTIPVSISESALRSPRRVVLSTATGGLVFRTIGGDQFSVVAPAPGLISVSPPVIQAGGTATMTLRGQNFTNVVGVGFGPASGVTAVPPFLASEGNTVLTFTVQVAAQATAGPRTVVVTTAAGDSSPVASPANTFQVAQQVGATYAGLMAQPVGVVVGSVVPQQITDTMGVYAPAVGVVFTGTGTLATQEQLSAYAGNVGVVVGVASTRVNPRSPDGFVKGSSGTLVVDGFGLDQVGGVSVVGATGAGGLTFGTPVANGSGTQLTIPVNVAGTATSGAYRLKIQATSGTATFDVPSTDPEGLGFSIGALPTQLDSVSPIVLEQGKTYTFTLRGTNLRDVYQLATVPAAPGLLFGAIVWGSDGFGEKLTVPLRVDPNATLGSFAVRLRVPGGLTSADAVPANTITIVVPQ